MADRPILFSGPMVRAILDGRKTQTRRVLKPQPVPDVAGFQRVFANAPHFEALDAKGKPFAGAFPDGPHTLTPYPPIRQNPGDRQWVREAHRLTDDGESGCVVYEADDESIQEHVADVRRIQAQLGLSDAWAAPHLRKRPSIHLPRWASRLTLTVTDVRVQRVQEISEDDAIAEGCRPFFDEDNPVIMKGPNGAEHSMAPLRSPVDDFHRLWDNLNTPRGYGWDANPWVVALTFSVHRGNIDQMAD